MKNSRQSSLVLHRFTFKPAIYYSDRTGVEENTLIQERSNKLLHLNDFQYEKNEQLWQDFRLKFDKAELLMSFIIKVFIY